MEISREQFFSAVRAGMWQTLPDERGPVSPQEWKSVFFMAKRQTVLGLVFDAALRSGAFSGDKAVENSMRSFLAGNILTHSRTNSTIGEVLAICRGKAGIEPVLLKGQGIAAFYKNPFLRQCGDIDLYVGKDKYPVFQDLAREKNSDDHLSWGDLGKHCYIDFHGINVECHRYVDNIDSPFKDIRFQRMTREAFRPENLVRLKIGENEVCVPGVRFAMLSLTNHIWHHFMSFGIGLRQFCDVAVYIQTHKDEIDWKLFRKDLRNIGLRKPWRYISTVIVKCLGVDPAIVPCYSPVSDEELDEFCTLIFAEGNFGQFKENVPVRPEGYWKGKSFSLNEKFKRWWELRKYYDWNMWLWAPYHFISFGLYAMIKQY